MRPIACLITDRRRLPDPTVRGLLVQIDAAAKSGVQLVQIRERDLEARVLTALTREALEAVRGTRTRIVVNDRLDVALAAGAHGVHLRGGSFAAARARGIAPPGFLIGRSIHSLSDAAASSDGADYLLFGHVFDTASKPGRVGAGLDALARVVHATRLPVLAVGGVTDQRIAHVLDAGAAGFAAISMFTGRAADSRLS